MDVKPYQRKVHYYETDQMGIVHHSNYVRWFEEARTDLLSQAHLDYEKLEEMGVFTAVLGYSCVNHKPARFGDTFSIQVSPGAFNGVRISSTGSTGRRIRPCWPPVRHVTASSIRR